MFCAKCGTQVKEGAKFCPKCGNPTGVVEVKTVQQQQRPVAVAPRIDQTDLSNENPKSSSKILIVIICVVAAILVLAGGAFVVVKFVMPNLKGATSEVIESADSEDSVNDYDDYEDYVADGSVAADVNKNQLENGLAQEYILPDSDKRLLTDADLWGLSPEELRLARNELYARHGRLFQDEELQAYFNSKSWYHGYIEPSLFVDANILSDIEIANRDLIVRHER